jgi:hypothetical protein
MIIITNDIKSIMLCNRAYLVARGRVYEDESVNKLLEGKTVLDPSMMKRLSTKFK